MARAGPECHRSIFWAIGRDRRLKFGMQVVLATWIPMIRPAQTWPGTWPARRATGPSPRPWGWIRRLKFGMEVVLATRKLQ